VLPQRWQTTENMDAGNVRRVVMLKPSKDRCDGVANSAWPPMRAIKQFALERVKPSRGSNPSYCFPAQKIPMHGRETTSDYRSTDFGRQSRFAPISGRAMKRIHHAPPDAARRFMSRIAPFSDCRRWPSLDVNASGSVPRVRRWPCPRGASISSLTVFLTFWVRPGGFEPPILSRKPTRRAGWRITH
jgi:hypothetical protein